MEIDEILDYALQLPDSEESTPFGPDTIVVKTNGKIFIVLNLRSEPISVNYKADPEQIIIQREDYPQFILPGYHMNKIHWARLVRLVVMDVICGVEKLFNIASYAPCCDGCELVD